MVYLSDSSLNINSDIEVSSGSWNSFVMKIRRHKKFVVQRFYWGNCFLTYTFECLGLSNFQKYWWNKFICIIQEFPKLLPVYQNFQPLFGNFGQISNFGIRPTQAFILWIIWFRQSSEMELATSLLIMVLWYFRGQIYPQSICFRNKLQKNDSWNRLASKIWMFF